MGKLFGGIVFVFALALMGACTYANVNLVGFEGDFNYHTGWSAISFSDTGQTCAVCIATYGPIDPVVPNDVIESIQFKIVDISSGATKNTECLDVLLSPTETKHIGYTIGSQNFMDLTPGTYRVEVRMCTTVDNCNHMSAPSVPYARWCQNLPAHCYRVDSLAIPQQPFYIPFQVT